jgi:DNA-binding MurR/RpiR family transcriptional regulator
MTAAEGATRIGAPSLRERVRRDLGAFTEAERRVAGALIADYPMLGLETVARFAERAGTSGPTILRFIRRLGFASYPAFQDAIRAEIQSRLQGPLSRYDARESAGDAGDLTARLAASMRQNLERMADGLSREDAAAVVERLADRSRRVFLLGGRFSGLIASYFHRYLRELRPGVRAVHEANAAWADELVDIGPGDVLVAFDFRRYQADVQEFSRAAAERGADVVLVTDVWTSPVAAHAAFVVACPVGTPSVFDSHVAGLAVVEILTAAVVERLGAAAKERIADIEALRRETRFGA